MLLREVAHSRTGDKGNLVTVSLIANRIEDYHRLLKAVAVERVSEHFGMPIAGAVTRYETPNFQALNFVLKRPLHESVTRSLSIDAHGKSFSSLFLGMEI